jgi:carbamoylphosphate synthase large subunit
MDIAEDRGRFSDLLKELDIPYPKYGVANDVDAALNIAAKSRTRCSCARRTCWAASA